jgi:hypothetical protein
MLSIGLTTEFPGCALMLCISELGLIGSYLFTVPCVTFVSNILFAATSATRLFESCYPGNVQTQYDVAAKNQWYSQVFRSALKKGKNLWTSDAGFVKQPSLVYVKSRLAISLELSNLWYCKPSLLRARVRVRGKYANTDLHVLKVSSPSDVPIVRLSSVRHISLYFI